jgi:hypothetical protein
MIALAVGWLLVQAAPIFAAPGFGVRGGSAGGGASAGSRGSVSGGASAGSGPAVGSPGSAGRGARSTDRVIGGSGPSASGGRSSVGWGVRPDAGVGRPDRGSRDRFFRDRPFAGSYRAPRRTIILRDRIYPYYSPFFYTSPFYSPFVPFTWGYDPFYGVFGYSDWYTSPDRRQPLAGERERYRDEEWPERARGNVLLDIEPREVEVRINGVLTTRDGRAVIDLPTGTYRVEVSRKGYRAWETDLVVTQGVRYRLEHRLERLRPGEPGAIESEPAPRLVGELILDVTPDDAIVTIDGRLLGIVNLLREGTALRSIRAGKHTLELTRPGYRTVTREITVDAREPLKLSIRMERE